MRAAQRVTDAAFRHICGYIKPGVTEQQIRAELENYMLSMAPTACRLARSSRAAPTAPTRTPSRARAWSRRAT